MNYTNIESIHTHTMNKKCRKQMYYKTMKKT